MEIHYDKLKKTKVVTIEEPITHDGKELKRVSVYTNGELVDLWWEQGEHKLYYSKELEKEYNRIIKECLKGW